MITIKMKSERDIYNLKCVSKTISVEVPYKNISGCSYFECENCPYALNDDFCNKYARDNSRLIAIINAEFDSNGNATIKIEKLVNKKGIIIGRKGEIYNKKGKLLPKNTIVEA